MTTQEQQKELIPDLDDLTARADGLRKDIDYLLDRDSLYRDEQLCAIANAAFKLVKVFRETSDHYKRGRSAWVQECITDWHHFRMDDEEGVEDPVYESVTYKGRDEWEIIMSTPTHGREKVVLHGCDGVNWPGVYSADPIESQAKQKANPDSVTTAG